MHTEHLVVESVRSDVWMFLFILFACFVCIVWFRFIYKTKQTNRKFDLLQKTVEEQQSQINELRRELDDLKRNN